MLSQRHPLSVGPVFLLITLVLACVPPTNAQVDLVGSRWAKVPAEDLAIDAPTVDPDASVEMLFMGLDYDNSDLNFGSRHSIYARLKVFTAKGVDELAQVSLRYSDDYRLGIFAARVIKPDGSIIEIGRESLFRTREETGQDRNVIRQAFAPPQLAVGDIVEYRALLTDTELYREFFIFFQDRWATRKTTVRIKSIHYPGVGARAITFKTEQKDGGVDRDGFTVYHLENIPATPTEILQPPVGMITPWLLFTQTLPGESTKKFWREFARDQFKDSDRHFRPSQTVKQESARLTAQASTSDEKLRALFDFCHTAIINSQFDPDHRLTPTQRESIESDDDPDSVLTRGFGSPHNIRVLFAALANAAGFEPRLARVSDRTKFYFSPKLQTERAVPSSMVAIKQGTAWQFFNPGLPYYEFGHLPWKHEGVEAVLADKRDAIFVRTPVPEPDYTQEHRRGQFELSEDGDLHGLLTLTYQGHAAIEFKRDLAEASPVEREKLIEEHLVDRFPVATLSDIEIRHLDDADTRLEIAVNLSIPGYADRLGSRLFVQPSVCEKTAHPLLTASERATDLVFEYPWTEEEEIELRLPSGFELEAPNAPQPQDFAPFASYEVSIRALKAKTGAVTLQYHRRFHCLGTTVPAKHYAIVKHIFEQVHQQDQHTLTLKRIATE